MTDEPPKARKRVNLALQGGGAHGAFTWGVLDRLLEDGRIEIEGVSGSSAGALNATVLTYGLATGGPERARALLDRLWHDVAEAGRFSPFKPGPLDRMLGSVGLDHNPLYLGWEMLSKIVSPYHMPDLNPLPGMIGRIVDFEALRGAKEPRLYVATTDVQSGRLALWPTEQVTPEVVAASAALPHLFQAVQLDGRPHWDGGYQGNPSLEPFFDRASSADILVVRINPLERPGTPRTPLEIHDRLNEISFNGTLMAELRAIEKVNKLIGRAGLGAESGVRALHVHMIGDDAEMIQHHASSKLNTDLDFLLRLKEAGRAAADRWLAAHYDEVGVRSTWRHGDSVDRVAPAAQEPAHAAATQPLADMLAGPSRRTGRGGTTRALRAAG